MNENNNLYISKTCSITGLPVVHKPEWTDVVLGEKYSQSISVIGNHIVWSRPVGFASFSELKKDFELTHQVINEVIPADAPYIFITDLSLFKGFSTKARRYSIDHTGDYDRLICLIFYQVSPFMRFSMNMAKRMKLFPLDFHFVKNYAEAVLLAQNILADHQKNQSIPNDNNSHFSMADPLSTIKQESIVTKDDWCAEYDNYSVRFELIDGNIIHSIARGSFKRAYREKIHMIRQNIFAAIHDKSDYYYVISTTAMESISFRARKAYIADFLSWYRRYPFKMLIFYGPNKSIRLAILLGKVFSPVTVHIAKDYHDARRIIEKDKALISPRKPDFHFKTVEKNIYTAADVKHFVGESIELLGDMNWESGDQAFTRSYDEQHPFSPIFDAINLIKNDFGELLKEKQAAANELLSLENDLSQARKMEAIGTIAGGVAHDFNNILSIILGNAELAEEDVPNENPAHKNLNEIQSACLRAKEIIQHLLNFARKTTPEKKPVNIGSLVKDSISFLRSSIPSNIEIIEKIPTDPLLILANHTQINQVLLNIVTNSKQAMANKNGQIEIGLELIHFEASAIERFCETSPGPYIKLSVKDTGCGIDPDITDKIFDPYFTTKEMGKGSGMGLSIVHGIIKNHDGWIRVSSVPGCGSTFDIFFPVVKEVHETAELPKNPAKNLLLGSERILFIDDEPSIVEIVKIMLSRLGYHVVSETDPEKALELFCANPKNFDLVISDMTMPVITGDDLTIKMLGARADIPIILCSGFSEKMNAEQAEKIGAKAFEMKPFSMENLSKTIRRVLDANRPVLPEQN